jgi:hypothetical protein
LDDQASPRAFSLTSGPQAGRDCWLRVQSGGWPGCGIFTPHRLPAGPASQWFGSSERCSVPLNCGADADGARTVDLAATSRTGGRWWISSGDGWVGDAEGREGMARAPRMPQCRTVCRAVGLGRCIVVDAFSRASTVAYATTRALWVGKTQVLFCSLFGELTLSARLRTIVRLSQNIIIERWVEFQYSTIKISILFIKMCVPC